MKPAGDSKVVEGEGRGLWTRQFLGTPLVVTDYQSLLETLPALAARSTPTAIEFCNTQIVAMRRTDAEFSAITSVYDYFIPDAMPLIWGLRALGVKMRDRVYGPSFMRYALCHETKLKHYFMGGSEETSQKLVEQAGILSGGRFQLVGATHKYSTPADSPAILEEIRRLNPDVIWVGLGTPKQQKWIHANKALIERGIILTVGFAFDVNAGTKRDAPAWMQRLGLTWVFRISQEPSRLLGRYLKYNTQFIFLCMGDAMGYFLKSICDKWMRPSAR